MDFIVKPQIIYLFYDVTNKNSFSNIIKHYEQIKTNSKYIDTKYILVGNKIDLLERDNELQPDESEKEELNKYPDKSVIEKFCKKNEILLFKEVSSVLGNNIGELIEETISFLYFEIISVDKKSSREIEITEEPSVFGRISKSSQDNKEIKKINRKKRCCCCITF